jgi:membrane protein implicated in regulation of membrane protease activity
MPVLAAIAFQILPFSWVGLLLLLLGLGLITARAVRDDARRAARVGLLCMLVGGTMVFDLPEVSDLSVSFWSVLVPIVGAFGSFAASWCSRSGARLLLRQTAGVDELIGAVGKAVSDLDPAGKVFIRGEHWNAVSIETIPRGARVEVTGVEGCNCACGARRARRSRRRRGHAWNSRCVGDPRRPVLSRCPVLQEYERGVIFRLGRFREVKAAGFKWIIPMVDRMVRISLREIVMDVPAQEVITRDNVSLKVNAVLYFRVLHPEKAVIQVENYLYGTSQMAQTTLRSVCGQAGASTSCSPSAEQSTRSSRRSSTARPSRGA